MRITPEELEEEKRKFCARYEVWREAQVHERNAAIRESDAKADLILAEDRLGARQTPVSNRPPRLRGGGHSME